LGRTEIVGVHDQETFPQIETLIPINQDTVPFYGHDLVAVRLVDGRICAVLRWLCDSLGFNIRSQLAHIRGRAALAKGLVPVPQIPLRSVTCLWHFW
jgi:hypothetical protein